MIVRRGWLHVRRQTKRRGRRAARPAAFRSGPAEVQFFARACRPQSLVAPTRPREATSRSRGLRRREHGRPQADGRRFRSCISALDDTDPCLDPAPVSVSIWALALRKRLPAVKGPDGVASSRPPTKVQWPDGVASSRPTTEASRPSSYGTSRSHYERQEVGRFGVPRAAG